MSNLVNFIFCAFAFNSIAENPAFSFFIRDRCVEKVANTKRSVYRALSIDFFIFILAIRSVEKFEEFFLLNMQL